MSPKISLLIPVYKSEKYIEQCLRSVFGQTYKNIETVIVDDATPDNSMTIAKPLIKQALDYGLCIKIVHHESNKGIAATRNALLANATGDYVFFVDSDDYIADNAVETLVNAVSDSGADIVRCSYFELKDNETSVIHHKPFTNKEDLLRQHISAWDSIEALWQLLIRRSIIVDNQLSFVKGINGPEDYLMSMKLFYYANNMVEIRTPVYYYRKDNNQSLTSTNKTSFHDAMYRAMDETIKFLKEKGIFDKYKQEALQRMFLCKQGYLTNKNFRNIDKYINTYPESNSYYKNFAFTRKQRLLFFLAEKHCAMLLKLILP
jgi:glycosyltransferase involved in cell wall biosynthesis